MSAKDEGFGGTFGASLQGADPHERPSCKERRVVEGFPLRRLLGCCFSAIAAVPHTFPGAARLVWSFPVAHGKDWEAAEAQMPTLIPHRSGFLGALCIPMAHCDALDPGQDQSKASGAWRCYQGGKVLWWIWFLFHPFKFIGTVTASTHPLVHPMPCLCTLAPSFRALPF